MNELNPEMKRLLAGKEDRLQRLAHARFPEKIAALIRLQTMAAPIQHQRGRMVKPWRLPVSAEALKSEAFLAAPPPPSLILARLKLVEQPALGLFSEPGSLKAQ